MTMKDPAVESEAGVDGPDEEADDIASDATDDGAAAKRKRAPSVPRDFPRKTLEESIRVPSAIKEKNGSNPWAPGEVATALRVGAKSGNFFYLTTGSRDYGMTEGSRDSAEISLTSLGRRIVSPTDPADYQPALREAFFNVDVFGMVFEHYHGNNLPEEPFLSNTLSDVYGVDRSLVSDFVDLFHKNCRFVGYDEGASASTPAAVDAGRTEVVATPRAKGESPVCFVAMPFSERDSAHPTGFFDEVMSAVLSPAIVKAGFTVRTAKRQGSDVIQRTIVNELLDADLVVVDLTEHNPNVLFELGMRLHSGLPTALVRATGTLPIFDVDHMLRVEDYSPNLWPSTVVRDVDKLADHIKAAWESRETTSTYMDILRS
jgi:hypothetical protein